MVKIIKFVPKSKKKRCSKCREFKDVTQFSKNKRRNDGYCNYCKKCDNEKGTKYRRAQGIPTMYENKECSQYLGIVIAERLCSHIFQDVKRMPLGHKGFDFICNRDKKIDVKSSCFHLRNDGSPRWQFNIKKNKIADYFLIMAFDTKTDLNPQHLWLIPGKELNMHETVSIRPPTLDKWLDYKQPINQAISCCNTMKE